MFTLGFFMVVFGSMLLSMMVFKLAGKDGLKDIRVWLAFIGYIIAMWGVQFY